MDFRSSSAVSYHQGVEHHHTLDINFMSYYFLQNEEHFQAPNKPCEYYKWRTTRSVIFWDKIIQNGNLKRISVEEIIVQEMAKRVAAGKKDHDANDRRKHAEYNTRQ